MNNLPNLFVIVKKIKIYRLSWLIRRIKQELRYPSGENSYDDIVDKASYYQNFTEKSYFII